MRETGAAALRNFELKSPTGGFVPLTEVVRLRDKQGFAAIQRRDGKSTLAVSGDIDNTVNTTDGVIEQLEGNGSLDRIATNTALPTNMAAAPRSSAMPLPISVSEPRWH